MKTGGSYDKTFHIDNCHFIPLVNKRAQNTMITDLLFSNHNFFYPSDYNAQLHLTPKSFLLFLLNKLTFKYRIYISFKIKFVH